MNVIKRYFQAIDNEEEITYQTGFGLILINFIVIAISKFSTDPIIITIWGLIVIALFVRWQFYVWKDILIELMKKNKRQEQKIHECMKDCIRWQIIQEVKDEKSK